MFAWRAALLSNHADSSTPIPRRSPLCRFYIDRRARHAAPWPRVGVHACQGLPRPLRSRDRRPGRENQTFKIACKLVKGFGLDAETALHLSLSDLTAWPGRARA